MATNRVDDDESYWGSSQYSKLKKFGINQFDDDVGSMDISTMLKSVGDDNDEVINWNDTVSVTPIAKSKSTDKVVASTDGLSARYRPPGSSPGGSSVLSSVSGPRGSVPHSLSTNSISSVSSAHSAVSGASLGDLSIAEHVAAQGPKRATSKSDVAKLEAEVNYLRRTVDYTKKERYQVVKPRETVLRMVQGKDYSLDMYKSKENKLELLDEAVKVHDGNAIITTVLFLHATVKSAIFNHELMQRPEAIDHYVSYLRTAGETQQLMDILGMLGRNEEAAMIKYKQAVSVGDPEKKCKAIETCKRAHFDTDPSLYADAELLDQQVMTLSRQIPVEKSDKQLELAGDAKFKQYPRAVPVVDQPVITWLFYCCFYHYNLGETNFASPLSIRRDNKVTEKQYLWAALNARAKLRVWKDVDELFSAKTWFKGMKLKAPMGFHRVVPVLHHYNAPRDILNKYCKLIDDVDTRLQVGQKYGCHDVVFDTLVDLRDRSQLIKYQEKLKPNSQEWFFAANLLRETKFKWKN